MDERRQYIRSGVSLAVVLRVGDQSTSAVLEDLSEGGLFVRTTSLIPQMPRRVTLSFELRGSSCMARGRVIRVASDVLGIGVRFSEVNEPLRQFITDLATLRKELRESFLSQVMNPEIRLDSAPKS